MRSVLIIALACLSLFACKQNPNKLASPVKGMVTPVYLNVGATEVLIKDYFYKNVLIDSFVPQGDFKVEHNQEAGTLSISPGAGLEPLTNLQVWTQGAVTDIPLFKSRRQSVSITMPDPDKKLSNVQLKGTFTNWAPTDLKHNGKDWVFQTSVQPAQHQYVMIVGDKEMLDANNPTKVSNGMGGFNSLLDIKDQKAKAPILLSSGIKDGKIALDSPNPIASIHAYYNNQKLADKAIKVSNQSATIDLSSLSGNGTLRLLAQNQFGLSNDMTIPVLNGKVLFDPSELNRKDMHAAIWYFMMVDRFNNGTKDNDFPVKNDSIHPRANHHGGDLQGIIQKIDDGYFKEMGINTVWLSPITQNPDGAYGFWPNPMSKFSSYHGYWPISNKEVDYRFGNEAVMRELIDKAHANNMNIILDYVANHVHQEHPLYKEHPEWATQLYLPDGTLNTEKWDDHRLTTWFDTFLPTLDFSKEEVVEAMTDSAMYWVTNYELDGFRHDATKHIQESFWRTLTQKVKANTDGPVFQIGETYGSYDLIRSYISTGMLDGQFDFNMYDAAVYTFAGNEEFDRLLNTLAQSLDYFGHHHQMGNISGNQDRARFISYASGDVSFSEDAKLAGWTRDITLSDTTAYGKLARLHAFNMSIPGIPVIYYGDEYGVPGGNDPDNRRMMKFEGLNTHEAALRETIAKLAQLRRSNMALIYGTTEIERPSAKVAIIKRNYLGKKAYTIFNHTDANTSINLPKGEWTSFNALSLEGNAITLPANSFDIVYE